MPNLAARAKEEVQKIFVIAVFFAIGFSSFVLHNRLLTDGSRIQAAPFARAIIGGLIVAKVLMTVDLLLSSMLFRRSLWSTTSPGKVHSTSLRHWLFSISTRLSRALSKARASTRLTLAPGMN